MCTACAHDDVMTELLAVVALVIGTSSWVVLVIGLVLSSTGALSRFVLLGSGTFMIAAFLAGFLTSAVHAEVYRFFLAPGVGFFLRVSIDIWKVLWYFISWPKIYEKRNVQYLRPTWCSCFLSFQRSFSHHTCPSWLWHLPFCEYDVTSGSPLVVLSVEERLNMTGMFPWKNHFFVTCLSSII